MILLWTFEVLSVFLFNCPQEEDMSRWTHTPTENHTFLFLLESEPAFPLMSRQDTMTD